MQRRTRIIGAALAGAIFIGILYELPHLLIKKNSTSHGGAYLPLTAQSSHDEAYIYAPEIEEASHGRFFFGDPAIKEHADDPSILAPLGPFVLGALVRSIGMERFWFLSDALFPPLLFLLFLALAWHVTRNAIASFIAAGLLIFFRQVASYFPWSEISHFKTFVSQFIPFVVSGGYSTQLAFGRLLTPLWTYIPLSLFFLTLIVAIKQRRVYWSLATGLLYGSLFYSYPFDAISATVILGAYGALALLARDSAARRTAVGALAVGALVTIPYWINFWQLSHLPQYHEILNRTGIELGRHIRWSLIPHYIVWIALGFWLFKARARTPVALFGSAVFFGAVATMNLQLVTGYLPSPKLFLTYSLALPLWISYLITGTLVFSHSSRRVRRSLLALGVLALALVTAKNVQIPFGYARQQGAFFETSPDAIASFAWIREHLPTDAVALTPSRESAAHLLDYTPLKVYMPPNGVVSSASNAELVERFFISAALFGADTAAIESRFRSSGIPAILENDLYVQDFDRSQTNQGFRNFDDLWHTLRETEAAWSSKPELLLQKYVFDYVYVGQDEKKEFAFSEAKFPVCIAPIYRQGEVTIFKRCGE